MFTKFYIDLKSTSQVREWFEREIRKTGELEWAHPRFIFTQGISLQFDAGTLEYFCCREGAYAQVPPMLAATNLTVKRVVYQKSNEAVPFMRPEQAFYSVSGIWD